jgi:hypothetical protein
MIFDELLSEVKKIKCEEQRISNENHLEVVVAKAELVLFNNILDSYFGKPLKPGGKGPSSDDNRIADPYGGIHKNQTLYLKKNDDFSEIVLLWPWGDGVSVTVKMIREQRK